MEFRIRVEFDVEVDEPSFVDAAFAAAEFLQRAALAHRFSRFSYDVAAHRPIPPHGTQYVTVDLEDIEPEEDDKILSIDLDQRECFRAGEHLKRQRHRWQDCINYHEGE